MPQKPNPDNSCTLLDTLDLETVESIIILLPRANLIRKKWWTIAITSRLYALISCGRKHDDLLPEEIKLLNIYTSYVGLMGDG